MLAGDLPRHIFLTDLPEYQRGRKREGSFLLHQNLGYSILPELRDGVSGEGRIERICTAGSRYPMLY